MENSSASGYMQEACSKLCLSGSLRFNIPHARLFYARLTVTSRQRQSRSVDRMSYSSVTLPSSLVRVTCMISYGYAVGQARNLPHGCVCDQFPSHPLVHSVKLRLVGASTDLNPACISPLAHWKPLGRCICTMHVTVSRIMRLAEPG